MKSEAALLSRVTAVLLLVGCQSSHSLYVQPASPKEMVDITFYGPIDSPGIPFTMRAYIVRTNSVDPASTMKIRAVGAVAKPGLVELKIGATLLEAIKTTGGFVPHAYARRILVTRDGRSYSLQLHYIKAQEPHCYKAWYGDEHPPGDFVLQPDDVVFIAEYL
jgi:SLBB domain